MSCHMFEKSDSLAKLNAKRSESKHQPRFPSRQLFDVFVDSLQRLLSIFKLSLQVGEHVDHLGHLVCFVYRMATLIAKSEHHKNWIDAVCVQTTRVGECNASHVTCVRVGESLQCVFVLFNFCKQTCLFKCIYCNISLSHNPKTNFLVLLKHAQQHCYLIFDIWCFLF